MAWCVPHHVPQSPRACGGGSGRPSVKDAMPYPKSCARSKVEGGECGSAAMAPCYYNLRHVCAMFKVCKSTIYN